QTGRLPPLRLLGQLHRTYILAQGEEGLVVIDQHAAHERVLYERLLRARAAADPAAQTLITPLAVELDGREAALLPACQDTLAALGFHLEPFGARAVLLRAIPPTASPAGAERLLRELLSEALERDRPAAARDLLERLTIATACHTAIRAGDSLSGDQMAALLRDLAATEDPFTCFHGRPTMVTVRREQIERWFLRR
ncbi:MAG TPA: DNA mismatch repair protein MutL, partial [bacterium]|nr:DNA mismatch repair protein MutL [bacterium]